MVLAVIHIRIIIVVDIVEVNNACDASQATVKIMFYVVSTGAHLDTKWIINENF